MKLKLLVLSLFSLFAIGEASATDVTPNGKKFTDVNGIQCVPHISSGNKLLPLDTIMPLASVFGGIIFLTEEGGTYAEHPTIYDAWFEAMSYYKRDSIRNVLDSTAYRNLVEDAVEGVETTWMWNYIVQFEWGGHYRFNVVNASSNINVLSRVQMNTDAACSVYGSSNGNKTDLFEHMPLDIHYDVRSGFPYQYTDYNGTAHLTILDPDSVVIATKDVTIAASADSTMMEYHSEHSLLHIASARLGRYIVKVEAPWQAQPMMFGVVVTDPLANASSSEPKDATYRFADNKFTDKSHTAWITAQGQENEYFKADYNGTNLCSMRAPEGEVLSTSQQVDKMPKGWYELSWSGFYMPDVNSLMSPSAGVIKANGATKTMKHAIEGATCTTSDGYYMVKIPQSLQIASEKMSHYTNKLVFEVDNDSLASIGVEKAASQAKNEWMVVGTPRVMFHGKGLAYGNVTFLSDSIYHPQDTISISVVLNDGIGQAVPKGNSIIVTIAKGTTDASQIVDTKSIQAGKADTYRIKMAVPEGTGFQNGQYAVYVLSLENDNKYEVQARKIIAFNGADDPSSVKPITEKSNTGNAIFDTAGRRVTTPSKGSIYVTNGKKYVNKQSRKQ